MKTVLRNLLCVLRRFKIATILNVLGLSVAFTAFMIIMMQVDYDNGYNKSIKGGDCIYRLTLINNAKNQGVICRPLSEMFTASSPHIKAGAIESTGSKSFFRGVPWTACTLKAVLNEEATACPASKQV